MTPVEFAYWLKGYMDIEATSSPSHQEWQKIKDQLDKVINDSKNVSAHPFVRPDIITSPIVPEFTGPLTDYYTGTGTRPQFLGNTTCESNH